MLEILVILTQIIFINIILTADNAIIIGSIAANFVPKNRKQIILWGVGGALIFKIIFASFATYLFQFYFIKILGGLLLIWIVNDLRKDLFEIKKIKSPTKKSKEPSYIQSVYKVLFADLTLSFDNVSLVLWLHQKDILKYDIWLSFIRHSYWCSSNLSCSLYTKTSMDCLHRPWFYLDSCNSTCNRWISRFRNIKN